MDRLANGRLLLASRVIGPARPVGESRGHAGPRERRHDEPGARTEVLVPRRHELDLPHLGEGLRVGEVGDRAYVVRLLFAYEPVEEVLTRPFARDDPIGRTPADVLGLERADPGYGQLQRQPEGQRGGMPWSAGHAVARERAVGQPSVAGATEFHALLGVPPAASSTYRR